MRLLRLVLCITLLSVSIAVAQDNWKPSADGSLEYNCDTLTGLLDDPAQLGANAEQIVARTSPEDEITLQAFLGSQVLSLLSEDAASTLDFDSLFADARQACASEAVTAEAAAETDGSAPLFMAVANGNVNIRACAGTDCDVVGTTVQGTLFPVVAISGDWYEVEFEDGTAFISAPLMSRGPDAVIDIEQTYHDPNTGCAIIFDVSRGDMDVAFVLYGLLQEEALVDLYLPQNSQPLPVLGQAENIFLDTDEPYINQYYYLSGWPLGTYQMEITLGSGTSKLAFDLTTRGEYDIFVECNTFPTGR